MVPLPCPCVQRVPTFQGKDTPNCIPGRSFASCLGPAFSRERRPTPQATGAYKRHGDVCPRAHGPSPLASVLEAKPIRPNARSISGHGQPTLPRANRPIPAARSLPFTFLVGGPSILPWRKRSPTTCCQRSGSCASRGLVTARTPDRYVLATGWRFLKWTPFPLGMRPESVQTTGPASIVSFARSVMSSCVSSSISDRLSQSSRFRITR